MIESDDIKKLMTDEYKAELCVIQQTIKKYKIPVIILFEGWGASGKGYIIGKLIESLDPRGFKVYTIGERTADEKRFPPMYRYWSKIPEYGNMSIFDRSWYRDVSIARVENDMPKKEVDNMFGEINNFEKQLSDDGYLILKFFLKISKQEQRKRFEKLEKDKETRWRVTKSDWEHHKNYDKYYDAFKDMVKQSDNSNAAWIQIDSTDQKEAVYQVLEKTLTALKNRIELYEQSVNKKATTPETFNRIVPQPSIKLSDVDMNVSFDENNYKKELKDAQDKLFKLHNILYQKKIPLVIVYEGWDAAGKGGNIKKLTRGLDPRGYEVVPIAAPTTTELNHQYLWRFWLSLPKDGHIAIYDRSWYGRVMVERIEGFSTEEQWKRAYNEMNIFEKSLDSWGAIIVKFWLHIDKDEQLKRFNDRQNTPEKQWKITEEDWRNREKWDQYEVAVDDMLKYTNTDYAPWFVIESNNKKYARLKVLNEVIKTIKSHIN